MTIEVYTDGACSGNPGPGGWGAVIKNDGEVNELQGGDPQTTNNRMELMAVIKSLEFIKSNDEILITTDSEYVKNGITKWIFNWLKNNWKTSAKTPVKNQDLWKELHALTIDKNIKWFWIKGHSGHIENERCDYLARQEIQKM